jgi:hypothetical protein
MNYRGQVNWPPVWVHVLSKRIRTLRGEVGILIDSFLRSGIPTKLLLRMDLNGAPYMGTLLFSDAAFCWQLHDILQQNLGRSIEEIGDLDLSFTL